MSNGNLNDIARKKMLDAKREAREKEREAKLALRIEQEQKRKADREEKESAKAVKTNKGNYARFVKESITDVYAKAKGKTVKTKDTFITAIEDGNIVGKVGNEYFYSYQEGNVTKIKLFSYIGKIKISDGDLHYPEFETVDQYKVNNISIGMLGNPIARTIESKTITSSEFYQMELMKVEECSELKEVEHLVDSKMKALENNNSNR